MSRETIRDLLDHERIHYPKLESCGSLLQAEGAAVNGVPMGWLPAADSLLHAGLVAYVIADIFARDEPEAAAIKESCMGYSVQIDDLTLALHWRGKAVMVDEIPAWD